MSSNPSFVRKVLAADAFTCLAAGAVMAAGASILALPTGLPAPLLLAAGLSLFPVAALFGWMARSPRLNARLLRVAVAGNVLWVLGSVCVLAVCRPTALGVAFVLAQAIVVGALAWLEGRGAQASAFA